MMSLVDVVNIGEILSFRTRFCFTTIENRIPSLSLNEKQPKIRVYYFIIGDVLPIIGKIPFETSKVVSVSICLKFLQDVYDGGF
jgi:hypothetical protein